MSERALPDVVTRVRVNTQDLTVGSAKAAVFGKELEAGMSKGSVATINTEKALAQVEGRMGRVGEAGHGLAGILSTGLTPASLALGAGLGLIVEGAHSMIDISEHQEAAEKSLEQAWGGSVQGLKEYKTQIDGFISGNSRYIQSQAEVTEGFAHLTRAGLNTEKAQRDMNIALDLSTLKHIPLADAVRAVTFAEEGRFRSLIDLGVSIKGVTAGNLDQAQSQARVAEAMAELEAKTKDGRKSMTEMDQASNRLSNTWQHISGEVGPGLVNILTGVLTGASNVYDAFDRFGHDDAWWRGLNDGIIHWDQSVLSVLGHLKQLSDAVSGQGVVDFIEKNRTWFTSGAARASGGPVLPNIGYPVGERGPEIFVPEQPGTIIPNDQVGQALAGAGPVSVTIQAQTNASPAQIAAEVSWELRKMRRF